MANARNARLVIASRWNFHPYQLVIYKILVFFRIDFVCLWSFPSLQLTIKAQDLGSTSLSTEKTITIALTNIDDNSPRFTEVSVEENAQ